MNSWIPQEQLTPFQKITENTKKARVNNNYGLVPYTNEQWRKVVKKPKSPNFDQSSKFQMD